MFLYHTPLGCFTDKSLAILHHDRITVIQHNTQNEWTVIKRAVSIVLVKSLNKGPEYFPTESRFGVG